MVNIDLSFVPSQVLLRLSLELKKCGCASTKDRCGTLRCMCYKLQLKCTDLCKCGELCKNRLDEDKISDKEEIENLI